MDLGTIFFIVAIVVIVVVRFYFMLRPRERKSPVFIPDDEY